MRLRQIALRLLSVVAGICTQSTVLHSAAETLFDKPICGSKSSRRPSLYIWTSWGISKHHVIFTRGRDYARFLDCCLDLIGVDPERPGIAAAPTVGDSDIPAADQAAVFWIENFKDYRLQMLRLHPCRNREIDTLPITDILYWIKPTLDDDVLECALNIVSNARHYVS